MKIFEKTHPSGLKQEAIRLFDDDNLSDYVIFKNIDKPTHTFIEIDMRGGFEKEIDYDFLKTLSDDEIFEIFFSEIMFYNWLFTAVLRMLKKRLCLE